MGSSCCSPADARRRRATEPCPRRAQVQGVRSRTELLKEHARRAVADKRSIIFGLQSFGEGIDLLSQLCEHVVIDKLPFTPPSSPVEEALGEWLSSQGQDFFAELSPPRAGMKLVQWARCGVRTVSDRAVITVCDTRLATMRYGQAILAGLPPFPIVRPVPASSIKFEHTCAQDTYAS